MSYLSKKDVFKQWDENNLFNQVKIDPEIDAIVWNDRIDIDALNLYLKIKNITFEKFKEYHYATN